MSPVGGRLVAATHEAITDARVPAPDLRAEAWVGVLLRSSGHGVHGEPVPRDRVMAGTSNRPVDVKRVGVGSTSLVDAFSVLNVRVKSELVQVSSRQRDDRADSTVGAWRRGDAPARGLSWHAAVFAMRLAVSEPARLPERFSIGE